MAGLAAILTALARLTWRELGTLRSLTANNFFVVGALLLSGAGPFLWLLAGLLLLFPLSADPLSRAPSERVLQWPLSHRKRILLRLLSLALSPAAWLALVLLIYTAPSLTLAFVAVVTLIQTIRALASHRPRLSPLRLLPATTLTTKNLRQLLLHLDCWLAALISACGLFYRDPDALVVLTPLAMLALSTPANCLFSLDIPGGLTRYQLFPLSAFRILAAKNVAYLLLAITVSLPLAPLSGVASALTALAFGNYFSVIHPLAQRPWRFAAGSALVPGLMQSAALVAAGVAAARLPLWFVLIPFAAWLASLVFSSQLAARKWLR
jgi:hypothetical protein